MEIHKATNGGRKKLCHSSLAQAERLRVFQSFQERLERTTDAASARDLSVSLSGLPSDTAIAGVTSPLQIANKHRVKGALVSRVNGKLWDLSRPLVEDCELQLLGFDTPEGKRVVLQSAACVLSSVLENHFSARVCREGVSGTGFYSDYQTLSSALFLQEVQLLCSLSANDQIPFTRIQIALQDLRELFKDDALRLKLAEEQLTDDTVSVFRYGETVGVCSGALLPHSGFLKAFKMLQISPVTLPGSPELSGILRMIGVAFPGAKDQEQWEIEQEEAKSKDHRKIGKAQELFFFHEVSPGSAFFLPKGAHIYNTLTDFIKSEYRRRGFSEVVTPTLFNKALWEQSGHWEHYSENMFTVSCEPHTFVLKPMNCPAHCLMFKQHPRSWRELPLRLADFGALHRNEYSRALGGLTRMRRFCQDDAHIFCAPEQLEQEILGCLDFIRSVYQVFGFSFQCLLSTRPSSFLGDSVLWDLAEEHLESSLKSFGEQWKLNPKDGAFYGPKIDVQIADALGRQHQCATIQLDFQLPIRFNLQYMGNDEQLKKPIMIHRAVLGSIERMIAILSENYGGKWPLWLSPAQVMVVPVGASSDKYGHEVLHILKEAGFIADIDDDVGSTLNKKIRNAQLAQYNYMFVVGDKERERKTVNVRTRCGKQLGQKSLEEALNRLREIRETRSRDVDFDKEQALH